MAEIIMRKIALFFLGKTKKLVVLYLQLKIYSKHIFSYAFYFCKVIDEKSNGGYATPVDAEGKNDTFISRIRTDKSNKNSINLWIVSDNLLRGAALNAVEIAETYYNRNR